MANVRIVLNREGVGEVLKSDGAAAVCSEYAGQVLGRLPEGFETERRTTDRAVVAVYAATVKARVHNSRTNALLKAGGV